MNGSPSLVCCFLLLHLLPPPLGCLSLPISISSPLTIYYRSSCSFSEGLAATSTHPLRLFTTLPLRDLCVGSWTAWDPYGSMISIKSSIGTMTVIAHSSQLVISRDEGKSLLAPNFSIQFSTLPHDPLVAPRTLDSFSFSLGRPTSPHRRSTPLMFFLSAALHLGGSRLESLLQTGSREGLRRIKERDMTIASSREAGG